MEEKIAFTFFPVLSTERLELRQLKSSDFNEIFILRTDAVINKYIARTTLTSIAEAREFINKINEDIKKNKVLYWAITLKNNPALTGTICLWNFSEDRKTAELGYELFPAFQGKGIMNEAVKKVIEFGFHTIGLNTIEAFTHKDNLKSKSLLSKNNFIPDLTRTDEDNIDNVIFILKK